ncbi:uncharacterized protein MONOS_16034 [Monocercomonoides exilis]|uniref:uncharacterized protein n=1 Tax=Monocercomonoides exilis TaxID=2049356 RepID=UPI0035597412|nr:hypothetical protein MONOS_16034 [Monocercomonoides exilis]|eukprot:MONOS_16034.1-p1 / transcript=MONOS_16034.1 / gene=MONOS_16034 / organism=Monocercomonoides_exilis_PA203 / gene_product=unspecified product / transcript_product=unspecified product / location=Mono_scaffold01468:2920-3344(-) / protein_length=89 / sequence_SO=supercontig / SO=protein_coding / is_pseudo=false
MVGKSLGSARECAVALSKRGNVNLTEVRANDDAAGKGDIRDRLICCSGDEMLNEEADAIIEKPAEARQDVGWRGWRGRGRGRKREQHE